MNMKEFEDLVKKQYKVSVTDYANYGDTPYYSTGVIGLDTASGIGGFPRGRVIEIFGLESSGKSLISLQAIANAQKVYDKPSMYLDLEGSTPPNWLETLGIDLSKLTIFQTDPELYAERLFEIILKAVESDIYAYIVVDSVVGLIPKEELDGKVEDRHMALLARAMSNGMKKLIAEITKTSTCVIFVNQIRDNVGVIYGNKEVTPGGKALKFYAAQRYRVSKLSTGVIKDKGLVTGHIVKVKCVKNKLAAPQRSVEFPLYYTKGVDVVTNLVSTAINYGVVTREGMSYCYTSQDGTAALKIKGKEAFIDAINEDMPTQALLYKDTLKTFLEGKNNLAEGLEEVDDDSASDFD